MNEETLCEEVRIPRDLEPHPGWANNVPSTGITFDGQCAICGWKLENKPLLPGKVAIEGEGRRLARVGTILNIGGEIFSSQSHKLACSKCVPSISDKREE